jgi:sigma-B regulation protein RsbU (phosphoserine phosphatase)
MSATLAYTSADRQSPCDGETQAAGTEGAPRILIVEDDPLNRDLMERILAAEGFRTVAAGDGEEAFSALRSTTPDLILLDILLPGRTGFELCSEFKTDRTLRDIPVIFLSALDHPRDRLQGLRVGGADYIAKPFYAEEVLARIRVHLRLRQAMRLMALQEEANLAELRQAQRSILVLPEDLPEASFAVSYRPLGAVGGDIYDVQQLGDRLFAYFVADISGHGVGASFLTSAVKALLRQYSGPLYKAEETLQNINSVMLSTLPDGQYLTACYVRFYQSKRLLSMVSAGHPAPIHVSANGKAETFGVESDALGIFPSVILEKRDVFVEPGDRFYLYTDGLIENPLAPGGARDAGLKQLCLACEHSHHLPLAEAVNAIAGEVRPSGEPVYDDLLLLGVGVPG